MPDRLSIYNEALILLGERTLTDLSEAVESRRVLDQLWSTGVSFLHEGGFFDWSVRAVEWHASTDHEPLYGFQFAFEFPPDYVRIVGVNGDPYAVAPFRRWEADSHLLYADTDPIYLRYVSDSDQYMGNVGAWSVAFCKAFSAYLAFTASNRISQNKGERADLFSLYERQYKIAKSLDAMNSPPRTAPPGTWTQSRRGSRSYRGEGYWRT